MTVIALLSASYCNGDEIAAGVSQRMGWPLRTDEELFERASERHDVAAERFRRALFGTRSVFDRITHEWEINVALLRDAMASLLDDDPFVYHGHGTLLIPRDVGHVLRACLVARPQTRLDGAVAAGVGAAQAEKRLTTDDEALARWASHLVGVGPWTAELYDLLLPVDDVAVDEAVETICSHAGHAAVQVTEASGRALAAFQLAARVMAALGPKGLDVEASFEEGVLTLTINRYMLRLQRFEEQLKQLAGAVPGVRRVETRVGPHFHRPNIYGEMDLSLPRKILLVDDEVEFVQTLSERLQTRNLESAVAYDGEQALAIADNDAPDVMVLDMKMPGLDGMQVLREVKRRHPATEVIVLTAHGTDREREQALELGAFAYLRKPADIDDLARLMKEAYGKVQRRGPDGDDDGPARGSGGEEG